MENELDLNDIMLEATAEIQETLRELLGELGQARDMADVAMSWATSPEEMKDQFASDRPNEYAALTKALEARRV